jgi:hypothetical protein
MANTYTHRIISLKKENGVYLNMIKSFVIEVIVSDGSNQISEEYKINLPDPEMDFTEYQDLQESDLISWYENDIIQKEFVTIDIDKKLQEHIQDTVESNFPWS